MEAILTLFQNSSGYRRYILVAVVLFITVIIQKIIKSFLQKHLERSSKRLKVDETQYRFFRHFISAFIYIIGIGIAISMIPSLRALSISLFAGAGVVAVVVGFASQQAFSNIVSGVFIALFRPFRVGDRIKLGMDLRGTVEDINLRHTVIRDFENKRIIVPNSIISAEKIENATIEDPKICKWVEIGISYDADIDKAMSIIQSEAMKHQLCIDNRTKEEKENKDPQVRVRVIGFGDSSVLLRAWIWAKDPQDAFVLGCDLNKSIKERFDKEDIEIPFPYRTIVYKKDLTKPKRRMRR